MTISRSLRLLLPVAALVCLAVFVARATTHAAPVPPATVSPEERGSVSIRAEARVVAYPGAEVTVGSEIAGRVVTLAVREKSTIRKGDLLVALDGSETEAALAEARARIAEETAALTAANADVERMHVLADSHAISQQELDHATRDRDAAEARRTAAVATADRLAASLAKTRIVAPIDGVVTDRRIEIGEIVSSGAPLVTIADLHRTRIEAEVDEYDAGRIALGAPVTVSAEGYGGQTWAARVEEIPDQVVGRRLKPEDPGRPSDTRVLLVKIALSGPTPLKLGQRVEVMIKS